MEKLLSYWPWFVGAVALVIDVIASAHAVLHKRDSRAAIAWVGLIWLAPLLGALLYFCFGINRIQRRAHRLKRRRRHLKEAQVGLPDLTQILEQAPASGAAHLHDLAGLIGNLTGKPLLAGNRVQTLHNGDEAYAAMLEAINGARHSISLSTYIFDNDRVGKQFIEALGKSVARGVEVRVMIDDVGVHYSWPTVLRPLHRAGVRVAPFLPKLLPWYFAYANLCNHRKILVVDGRAGFTGGMNIREGHHLMLKARRPVQDLHFRIDGPAVAQLQEVFAEDWLFCTREVLLGEKWFPPLEAQGTVLARGVSSGPDDDFEKLRMTYLGAITCAQTSIRIVTPYFLPDYSLAAALNVAALRGVQVDILLPQRNNLLLVQWASMALLWQVLEHGCRVWLTPPPFDHTKLILIDGFWTLLGSANWDARSLRLNFEFNVECYDASLAATLEELVGKKLKSAQPLTMADVDGRSLLIKLRDGVARLLTPYL